METLSFDIETIPQRKPLTDIQREALDKKLDRYFWNKTPTEQDRAEAERMLMATNPFLGEIVCIGLMKTNDVGQYDHLSIYGTEEDILTRFWKTIRNFKGLFISFNGLNFDVPFILKRSMVIKIGSTNNNFLNTKRFLRWPHFDVMQVLADYNPGNYSTLKLACESLGIESPKEGDIVAATVAQAFEDGRIEEIAEYCLKDVVATYHLYNIVRAYAYENKRY